MSEGGKERRGLGLYHSLSPLQASFLLSRCQNFLSVSSVAKGFQWLRETYTTFLSDLGVERSIVGIWAKFLSSDSK